MRNRFSTIVAISATAIVLACLISAADPEPTPRPAAAPASQPAAGVVRGRISMTGSLSLQKPDLTRVVVFIGSDAELDSKSASAASASISQRNKTFTPNFLVVPRGTAVEFPNWDKFDHNVFSRSAAAPAFDLDRYPFGQSKVRVFEKLGVVQVFCNIHPQMRAVIYVTPNAFFARPDTEGRFEITGLPAGNYELVAWHERCEEKRQAVKVTANDPVELALTLKESRDRVLSTTDADRKSSYGVERGLGIKRERLNLPVVTESHPAPEDSRP